MNLKRLLKKQRPKIQKKKNPFLEQQEMQFSFLNYSGAIVTKIIVIKFNIAIGNKCAFDVAYKIMPLQISIGSLKRKTGFVWNKFGTVGNIC